MATRHITEEIFQSTIQENPIVIFDFWAEWCGPCRRFAPVFEQAAQTNPDIVFGKVDTEEQRGLASALSIQSIPTLMVFRDGILLFNEAGALAAPALDELIREVRALDMDDVRKKIAERA